MFAFFRFWFVEASNYNPERYTSGVFLPAADRGPAAQLVRLASRVEVASRAGSPRRRAPPRNRQLLLLASPARQRQMRLRRLILPPN